MKNQLSIDKLFGLNTSAPRSTTGQPNVLKNVSFFNTGGWTSIGGVERKASVIVTAKKVMDFGASQILITRTDNDNVTIFHIDENLLEIVYTTPPFNKNNLVQIDSSVALSYENGVGVSYIYGGDHYRATVPPITLDDIDITFEENDWSIEISPVAKGDKVAYQVGDRVGFNFDEGHYIFMFVQPWLTTDNSMADGSTLNPRPVRPFNRIPLIIFLPKDPIDEETGNPVRMEYFVKVRLPTNYRVYFYGKGDQSYTRTYPDVYETSGIDPLIPSLAISRLDMCYARIRYTAADGSEFSAFDKFVAMNDGTGPSDPETYDWSVASGYGTKFLFGDVTFINIGTGFSWTDPTFAEYYINDCVQPPLNYIKKENLFNSPYPASRYGFVMLEARGQFDGTDYIYTVSRSKSRYMNQEGFLPFTFYPFGNLAESHMGRSWIVADGYYEVRTLNYRPVDVVDVSVEVWETTDRPKTVYYSEFGRSTDWPENFIILRFKKSVRVVAMRSIGEYLIFLGDKDGCVLSGDSEANFRITPIDLPGAYYQHLSCVVNGVMYYRGVGGIYRVAGGSPEKISSDLDPIFRVEPNEGDSIGVDNETMRLYYSIYMGRTYVFDVVSGQWSEYADEALISPTYGTVASKNAYLVDAGKLYQISDVSPHTNLITATFDMVDGGNPGVRKRYLSAEVSFELDADLSVAPYPQVRMIIKSRSSGVTFSTQWQDIKQKSAFHQFRFRNIVGSSAEITVEIDPNGTKIMVHPPIRIEVDGDAEIRNLY